MQHLPKINSLADIQTLVVSGFTDWKQYGEVAVKRDGDLLLFDYTAKALYPRAGIFLNASVAA